MARLKVRPQWGQVQRADMSRCYQVGIGAASSPPPTQVNAKGLDGLTGSGADVFLNPVEELTDKRAELAEAIWSYARPDRPSELGALKVFRIPQCEPECAEALRRLHNEITVLRQNRLGLAKLLDCSEAEAWIVTEYYQQGTVEKHLARYRGNALSALIAFRSLVDTTASLHKEGIVHRDIKPNNVFVSDDALILGDLGIVFLPVQGDRLTETDERVGPRDYMPQWGDLGVRLERVQPNFDVYMLGKLLWCMVSGRLKLPREYHKRTEYSLTELFPNDPDMHIVNRILDKCLVEEPDQCLPAAQELLMVVDASLGMMGRGGQLLAEGVPQPCPVCGAGFYKPVTVRAGVTGQSMVSLSMAGMPVEFRLLVCDKCGNARFFRPRLVDMVGGAS